MKHDPHLANDLVIKSLVAKIDKLTARVEALEAERPKRRPHLKARKAQPSREDKDAAAFAAMRRICLPIADAHHLDLSELRGREMAAPRITARSKAMRECRAAGISASAVGRYFDGRDHTTVLHLVRRLEERLGTE